MVITDIDTDYTSREASGRFQLHLNRARPRQNRPALIDLEQRQAGARAKAYIAGRRIDQALCSSSR